MTAAYDVKYMKRAMDLASMAAGNTSPNPMVGAVIVCNDKIIGEGYHTRAGAPHAEVAAIESVRDRSLLKKSSLYVTLEPCSHYGRTPPCAVRIAGEGIPRVVVGTTDTSDKVAGRGIEIMKSSGVEVITGVMEDQCRYQNRRFFTFHEKSRPYIILKWAQSSDGFLDRLRLNNIRGPNWITGREERITVHKWRTEEDAIIIGDKTACNDDPGLDARYWAGNSPQRFVLSEKNDLPANLKIFRSEPKTVIFSPVAAVRKERAVYVQISDRRKALEEIMSYMYTTEILSLIVEGGYAVLSQFIEAGLWDEARIFKGQVVFGEGLKAPSIEGVVVDKHNFKDSILEFWRPK